ncbi:restriction endonuclease subunit S [Bacteroides caccae]|uniref:Restriction endonuclease subunit S n=1 Tax=Bacteroides caccae TaxID=47678 RepID=A0AAW7WLW5_9BACE|nr:restriction endonuclease subunit S [Bacteroides caccae]MDO6327232.1 restriction endonuclease subunit S [Bacteroides caccae]MDO6357694.1 restriction endonuclease subunit S [Bacteroides caccae]
MRFPEFTEEWVNVSLKDVADFQKERISSGLLDESTYISTENILQNFQGVQSAISIPANTNVVAYKKNDILLSNIRPYLKKVWFSDRIGGCSADVFVLRSKTCEPEFLYNVIASDKFINYVMSGAKGVKMPRGDKNQMESFSFSIPAVVEQRKISRLFQLLDERIVTQNKIIEKLQSLIKGIVVSHYSTTAHIIKVRIRELGEAYSTMVMSKEQLTNDGNLCVFYGELFTLYDCVIDEVKSRTSLEKVSSTLSHGRDLLFPASTTVDAVSLIAPSALMQKDIILGGDMFGIKVSEAYNPIYLSYYFNYIANKRLAKYAKGTTIIHLHYNEIANVAIELPNIEEQDKIVSTILEYSAKLSIEETILEKLFDLKQYLLKQLFI